MRSALSAFAILLAASVASASEPLRIEDFHFFPESGWNRSDAALQYSTLLLDGTLAHEIGHEWATGARHQIGFTLPLYTDTSTGAGDMTLNYRYQLLGRSGSRIAAAPRVSMVLPTRSRHYGASSDGLQVSLPLSIVVSPRLTSHTNVAMTWFRGRGAREVAFGQSLALAVTGRATVALDAAHTRASDGSRLTVVRPGAQYTFDLPGGMTVSPGIAAPLGGGLLFYVAIEQPLGK